MLHFALSIVAAFGPADERDVICPNGTRPADLVDMSHQSRSTSLDVKEGHGILTVRDVYVNDGDGPGQIEVGLDVDGFVKAARVKAEGRTVWQEGKLDDVAAAAALFSEYRLALSLGVEPEEAKKGPALPALLVGTDGAPSVQISVLAPCPVRAMTVEIDVVIPSVPVDGAWQFMVPEPLPDMKPVSFVVDSEMPIRVVVDGQALRPGTPTSITATPENAPIDVVTGAPTQNGVVVVRPLSGPKLRTRGYVARIEPMAAPVTDVNGDDVVDDQDAQLVARPDEVKPVVIARAELDLPNPLADAPAGLRIVFVVDASVSVGADGLAKQLQLVDGILDAAPPDAKYALIAATRKANVVVAPWRPRNAPRDDVKLELGNGSNVPEAIAKARAIASDVDAAAGEVGRVIVMSDMKLKLHVDDDALAASFGSAAKGAPLTHAITIPEWAHVEESMGWSRWFPEDYPRAAGPEATGGIWIEGGYGDDDEDALFPHLIAPTRIDRPRVTIEGVDILANDGEAGEVTGPIAYVVEGSPKDDPTDSRGELGIPSVLVAGSGLRVEVALDPRVHKSVRDLRVEGLLWATPFDERARPDRALLGLAAVDELAKSLDDDIVRRIARVSGAVSRVTSLVEVPTFRPARLEEYGLGSSGCGCGGCGCSCGMGGRGFSTKCGGVRVAEDLKEREVLERLLAQSMRECLVPRAVLDVEFGELEILEVVEREGGSCVSERFWWHRLDVVEREHPRAFQGQRQITVGVDLHAG